MISATHSKRLEDLLGLRLPPVAIAFLDAPPAGVPHVSHAVPSGCTFWKLAAEGHVFYTEPGDHVNCPIGAHTHGIPLTPAQGGELEGLIKTMVGLEYLRMEEVPSIPTLKGGFKVAVYAPLAKTPVEPDVVLLRGSARQMMVAIEAASALGLAGAGPLRERPTCAMVAETMSSSGGSPSFGCIGNRVYTGLGDDEIYFAVPGAKLAAFVDKLATLVRANRELEGFHRSRLPLFAAS